jgi:hypothetical protein
MRPHLLSFERAWTDAAFDAIYPDGTALGPGIRSMYPARFFDELLGEIPLEQSIGLRLALWIVALAPLFTVTKLGTIASIAPGERTRVLERLLASPVYAVRQLVMALKAMATLLYAQSAAVRTAMTTPNRYVALRRKSEVEGERHEHAAAQ